MLISFELRTMFLHKNLLSQLTRGHETGFINFFIILTKLGEMNGGIEEILRGVG